MLPCELPSRFSLKTKAQPLARDASRPRLVRLRPDLLVQASGANRLVVDTKWKLLDGSKATGADKYELDQSDFDQPHAYGQSHIDGRGDVVPSYSRTEAFNEALPMFEFPKSDRLRLWVPLFCPPNKRLLLPPCGSLDAPFARGASSLLDGRD